MRDLRRDIDRLLCGRFMGRAAFANRNHRAAALPKIPPRVAILKPLRGVSDHLRENIISFLEMAYARVEYISASAIRGSRHRFSGIAARTVIRQHDGSGG